MRLLQVVNQDSNPSPTDLMDRVPTTKEIVKILEDSLQKSFVDSFVDVELGESKH